MAKKKTKEASGSVRISPTTIGMVKVFCKNRIPTIKVGEWIDLACLTELKRQQMAESEKIRS